MSSLASRLGASGPRFTTSEMFKANVSSFGASSFSFDVKDLQKTQRLQSSGTVAGVDGFINDEIHDAQANDSPEVRRKKEIHRAMQQLQMINSNIKFLDNLINDADEEINNIRVRKHEIEVEKKQIVIERGQLQGERNQLQGEQGKLKQDRIDSDEELQRLEDEQRSLKAEQKFIPYGQGGTAAVDQNRIEIEENARHIQEELAKIDLINTRLSTIGERLEDIQNRLAALDTKEGRLTEEYAQLTIQEPQMVDYHNALSKLDPKMDAEELKANIINLRTKYGIDDGINIDDEYNKSESMATRYAATHGDSIELHYANLAKLAADKTALAESQSGVDAGQAGVDAEQENLSFLEQTWIDIQESWGDLIEPEDGTEIEGNDILEHAMYDSTMEAQRAEQLLVRASIMKSEIDLQEVQIKLEAAKAAQEALRQEIGTEEAALIEAGELTEETFHTELYKEYSAYKLEQISVNGEGAIIATVTDKNGQITVESVSAEEIQQVQKENSISIRGYTPDQFVMNDFMQDLEKGLNPEIPQVLKDIVAQDDEFKGQDISTLTHEDFSTIIDNKFGNTGKIAGNILIPAKNGSLREVAERMNNELKVGSAPLPKTATSDSELFAANINGITATNGQTPAVANMSVRPAEMNAPQMSMATSLEERQSWMKPANQAKKSLSNGKEVKKGLSNGEEVKATANFQGAALGQTITPQETPQSPNITVASAEVNSSPVVRTSSLSM